MNRNEQVLNELKTIECQDATYVAKDPALVFARGSGSTVYDLEGRDYIDLCAGFGVLNLGHHPEAYRSVWRELAEADHPHVMHAMGDVYPGVFKKELIEKLLSLLPKHFSRVSLALSGSQAVEVALKTAMLATKGDAFIAYDGAYHGVDLGALSVTYRNDFREHFETRLASDRTVFCPKPESTEEALRDLALAVQTLKHKNLKPAAVILEPLQGRAGMRAFGTEILKAIRSFCDQHQIVLIYDEVFSGLGRTARYSYAEVVPSDLSCFGKSLGGGLPLSACVGTEKVMSAWPENQGEAIHTGTFFGHPLACRLGHIYLSELKSKNLVARAAELGETIRSYLEKELKDHPWVTEVRGEGLMLAVAFSKPGLGALAMDELRKRGIIALPSGEQALSLSITPALTIPGDVLMHAMKEIVEVLRAALNA